MKLSSLYKKALRAKRQYLHPWCAAIIVAAGSATRMNGVDKIQADLCGQPVLCRTLAAFERCELVDEMIVVTRREQMERVSELCVTYPKVQMVVCGGETRVDSVCALLTDFRYFLDYHIKSSKSYLHERMRNRADKWKNRMSNIRG